MADEIGPIAPEGWEPVFGPVQSVPTVTMAGGTSRLVEGCVTVGNRVMAYWQRFGYSLGNGTIVGFERHIETGWIKVVIDYDFPTDERVGEDGYVRWDWDRTCLVHPAHWDDETQEESVARWRESIRQRQAREIV